MYTLTEYDLKYISVEIRDQYTSPEKRLADEFMKQIAKPPLKVRKISRGDAEAMGKRFDKMGFEVNARFLAVGCLPDRERSQICGAWMKNRFDFSGQEMPSTNRVEIQLQPIKDLYAEYKDSESVQKSNLPPVSINTFRMIFYDRFSYVKSRRQMTVQGTCNDCALINCLFNSRKDYASHEQVKQLRQYHDLTINREKQLYYDKRNWAFAEPESFLSGTFQSFKTITFTID